MLLSLLAVMVVTVVVLPSPKKALTSLVFPQQLIMTSSVRTLRLGLIPPLIQLLKQSINFATPQVVTFVVQLSKSWVTIAATLLYMVAQACGVDLILSPEYRPNDEEIVEKAKIHPS